MSAGDLIRRGAVREIIESTVDIEDADLDTLRSRLDSLPADPVATAALAFAEAIERADVPSVRARVLLPSLEAAHAYAAYRAEKATAAAPPSGSDS